MVRTDYGGVIVGHLIAQLLSRPCIIIPACESACVVGADVLRLETLQARLVRTWRLFA